MITIAEAMKVVAWMELTPYFSGISEEGRVLLGEELMAMVNWPPERILRNGHGEILPYVEPKERLAWILTRVKTLKVWPGIGQIRGMYCLRFKPADGIEADCDRELLGITDDGRFAEDDRPEQKYLPGPGDEPIGDLAEHIAGVAKRLKGKAQ
jgi:hypothetical protein